MEGWTFLETLYFSIVTATTVGFGDHLPTSDASKLFTVAYAFIGIGIVGSALQQIVSQHSAPPLSNNLLTPQTALSFLLSPGDSHAGDAGEDCKASHHCTAATR
jgi:hypothetical protein